jgi:ApbE superfamily uncharacterized protein (UPF0280 family)
MHFQHGPIDLVLEAWGDDVEVGYACAWRRFEGVLEELVAELPRLRSPVDPALDVRGAAARRMVEACAPHAPLFITPMAAVAGAVADEVLEALCAAVELTRAYVNNGGDIALHLAPGQSLRVGVVAEKHKGDARAAALTGSFEVASDLPVRGVATSGWRGRSLSFGIADSVTVLASTAAGADAAATMIANAVDVEHPAVRRAPASQLVDDTDLGDRLVTVAVGALEREAVGAALDAGARHARTLVERDLVWGAVLLLRNEQRVVLPEGETLGTADGASLLRA